MRSGWMVYLFASIAVSQTAFLDEPHLQTIDGHLYIYGGNNKNVSFEISPKGYLNFNGESIDKIVKDAKRAASSVSGLKYTVLSKLEDDLKFMSLGMEHMAQRLNACESLINNLQGGSASAGVPLQFQVKFNKLVRGVKTILRNLAKQECTKDPCLNGGTCRNLYLDYECRCLEGWEGKSCERDVNECAKFAGSDLGCQNGATCINKPGTYECVCAAGWYGLHCTRRSNDCSSGPPSELCGHGTCVTQTSGSKGYTCICDQGWKTDGSSPACTVDVDECVTYPCSKNPLVTCHNTPGNFFCGPCPSGYSGNGFACTDINECLTQNGGCSVQPFVQCINTIGSSTCGPCPPGYIGDGKTCNFVGKCNVDNGGCHPNARCQEVGSNIQCQCLPGYTGSGVGPFGCELSSGQPSENPCIPNPCKNDGRCYSSSGTNFTCSCRPGYTGRTCNVAKNACNSNPCQNGGTCVSRREYFFCRCTSAYTGRYCQKERQNCGGFLNADEGELQFPAANSSSTRYDHNLNCAWIIIVNSTLVINVTFDYFDLEPAPECQFDWVQIHDGKSASDHIIGKFCGNSLPNNGTIIGTTNYMYMWFKSDGSKSKIGFKLKWSAVRPVCGGPVNASIHGTIRSPGSPGKYPPNRDCLWLVTAPLGQRITFTFFEVYLETHENCSYDFLEFHEELTLDSPVLARYCNTSIPPPLITPGNTALVYFHSDQYQSDRGFQIAYHPTPGIAEDMLPLTVLSQGYPGCGGIFTNRKGEISPPMEDGRYMRNMDCAWLIRLPNKLRIKAEFKYFQLEDSLNLCSSDFLEIRDGSSISAPLIGRYCGFVPPPAITSEGNVLYVRFHSDNSIQSTGFRLVYTSVCSEVFTEETGVVKSPGYPEKYRSQEVCIFIIKQPPGKVIHLEFQDFEFELNFLCFYDYIEIRDGNNEQSPLIKRYCGSDRPPRIVSTHNYLWLKMVTDNDTQQKGFYANYTTVDVSCGGIFTASEGEISSPSETGAYPPNHNCRWMIVGKPEEIIELTFTTFKLEFQGKCEFDYVAVYDNTSISQAGGLIGKFCGESIPPVLMTTENIMTIVFHSDSSVSLGGFSATYKTVNMSTVCGGNYFTTMGVIKSPNYPNPYPNAKTCTWVIRVPYGNKVSLTVSDFLLEGNDIGPANKCGFDYLEIRDGGYESSPLIGRYCGAKIPKRIVSQSNILFLKFKSDNTFPSFGFLITWDGTLAGCGGSLSSVSGSIISPNYPEPYGSNSLCIYKISVAMGSRVLLNVMDLDLEDGGACLLDYIEIFDGHDKSAKSLGRLCSSVNHPASVTSSGNLMMIKFVSNIRVSGRGFYFKYRTECKTNVTGHRGVIESPNFPDKYPPGSNCLWIIKAPMGNKINISFFDFNFVSSCTDDYVEIQEGSPSPTNTIGKFCKDKKPTLIASSLDWVHIKFVSSQYSFQGGFRLEWVVNGCGGTYIKPQGSFTSPNYPKVYPPNTICEYYITVDPSLSINLYIRDISLESLRDCDGDSLEIYAGPDRSFPLLSKLCQKMSEPVQIQLSGNQMYLRFTADHITGGTGFYANYTTVPAKCGGHQISNTGRITSRNYPKNYNAMDSCLWVIQVEVNHRVRLTFEDFDLASDPFCNSTYVEVFDGPSESFPSLLKHCGNANPSPNPVISSSNYLTVRMRTDQGFPAKGFKAQYDMVCGATITAYEPGVITPSYYLHTVATSVNCTWTIISPEPDGHVTLTVSYMEAQSYDITCSQAGLYVYDGMDNNATLLGSYCGRSHLPVVSKGNALFLDLVRSAARDWYFWASYSSASSACGGDILSESGSFASPNYPSSYPPNAECIWVLKSAPGNRMQINFKEFDLAQNDHCNEEYIEVRETNAVGKLIGVYCGQSAPSNLTALSTIWVKFRSSKLATGNKGFLADYSLVFGNELTGKSGQIANPFYPKPLMRHVENMYWRVTVEFGNLVRLNFKEVLLDDFYNAACLSSVIVYDGFDETAPELLSVCGFNKPNPATSSSNVVYIVFTHFPIHHGSRFLLEWQQVDSLSVWTEVPSTSSPICSEKIDLHLLANRSVTLTNPGWPEPFTNRTNLNCEWEIQSPDYQHLTLTVNVLAISQNPRCDYSYLSVQTRTGDSQWKELNRLCLSNETDRHISGTNFMKIVFNSGYEEKTMFSVTVQTECGNSIRKSNGVVTYHWGNYSNRAWLPPNSFCQWDIAVNPGRKIRVVFTEFDFATSDSTCRDKYVLLRNGGSDESPLLGKGTYCKFPGVIPPTTSNRLFIKAKVAYQTSFSLRFEEVSPECGKRVKLDETFNETIITSPNYPNIPPSKIECVWTFSTSGDHRLQIDFLERFDLESTPSCDKEYVEIRDGGTELSEELGRFCSSKPSTQKSSGNMLLVKYYTNATNPKNGFKAQVSLARCGGVLRTSSGILTSPDYPNSYLYDTECRWEIEGEIRQKLQVTFEDLDLPIERPLRKARSYKKGYFFPNVHTLKRKKAQNTPRIYASDFNANQTNCSSSASIFIAEPAPQDPMEATIYRLLNSVKRLKRNVMLGYICSNEPVNPIISSSNKLLIVFQSGPSHRNLVDPSPRGFKLNFTAVGKGCSYNFDTPSGVIISPGYPNEAPNYYYCTWKISVPRGRRVTINVEDFDLPTSMMEQRVVIFNEHRYRSRIAVLTGSSKIEKTYKSSSNLMMVTFWSNVLTGSGHRGFKFTYNSDEAQVCGGILSENEGLIVSPENLTSFYCKWEFQARRPDNQTIVFYVKDAVIGNRTGMCSLKYGAVLAVTSRGPSGSFVSENCRNVSSLTIRTPFPYTTVTAIKSAWFGEVKFNITYKIFACGGTVYGPEATITSPNYPKGYSTGVDCAWLISFPPGQSIKLTFQDFNLQPSCSDFLNVKNGPSPNSPLIGQFCGTSVPSETPVISEGSSLFVEFHSDPGNQGKGFKISAEAATFVCGGSVHSLSYELMTPNFPNDYDNNQECEWEITSAEGTHIGLVFVDRFHIESSNNCDKDYVKVYDYVKDDWKLITTLCGRELPSVINSTSNRMKVLFRSNDAIVSEGFKAKWYQNCGGTLWNVQSGTIVSPGYPGYKGNLDCVYVIEHDAENTFLNFTYFNLEKPFKGRCLYDSVAIYEAKWDSNFELVGKYCGSKIPSPKYLRGKVKIHFKTDEFTNFEGFVLNFNVSKCGGYVNESTSISYYTHPSEIDSYSYMYTECVWEIVAPKNNIVTLRVQKVDLPFSEHCSYPYLEASEERTNGTVILGRLCGKFEPRQVVIKSSGNKMAVKLIKTFQKDEGFSAVVVLTYGTAMGCGGEVTIDNNPETVQSPDINGDGFYDEFLDCTWVIRAKPFHQIVADFRSIDVTPCKGSNSRNASDSCDCDSVELLEGTLYHSEVLLRTCGRTIPPSVTSPGSVMSLKFTTDGAYNGRGFNIRFSSKLSPCGTELLTPTDKIQTLTSPYYPENYPEGLRCKWTIFDPAKTSKRIIHVHVVEWDIVESKDCSKDFLYLEDTGLQHSMYQNENYEFSRNKTAGSIEIIRGKSNSMYYYDKARSVGRAKFCGKGNSIDFYSDTDEITVGFSSTSGSTRKGFKLDYSLAGCTRNYTAEYGRIKNMDFKNNSHCYITISAPSPNHTISLYFSYFTLGRSRSGNCEKSYMEVRDGPEVKAPLIGKFCGYSVISPIFSSGQFLWLHFYHLTSSNSEYENVDFTYTTTDQGKGCGGRFNGILGTFTSPGYPTNTRKNSVCRWDITVPPGFELTLQFSAYDIGPSNTCSSDFIEFYDVQTEANTEVLRSRFCGRDTPAEIRSSADVVAVKYTRSVHNGGTGWQLDFKAVPPGFKMV